MPKEIKIQVISRGIIFGIATGIAFGIVRLFFSVYGSLGLLLFLLGFLIPLVIITYKFVGHPISGIFFGFATIVTQETFLSILRGGIPFYRYGYFDINYLMYNSYVLLSFFVTFIGFPLAGFLAGKLSQKRGVVKLPYSGSYELTELENKVLSYIKTNNNRIHIVECALALNAEPASVEKAVKSLQRKGEIQT